MLVTKPYKRENAAEYARKFAFSQNVYFGNFAEIGGNCTNFVSQAIFAGACQMNYTPTFGWYYIALNERSPSWTSVEYFYNFLIGNRFSPVGNGDGPFAEETELAALKQGDFVQLGNERSFYHTLVCVGFWENGVPLMAAHSNDAYAKPLTAWVFQRLRCIHLLGVRKA